MSVISFTKDTSSKIKLYYQLYERFTEEIKSGALKPKTKLPSIRQTAEDFSLSKNTVTKAYSMLEKNGFIYSEEKRGYFVNKISDMSMEQDSEVQSKETKEENEDSSIPTVESILKQRGSSILQDEISSEASELSSVIAESISAVRKLNIPTVDKIVAQETESVPQKETQPEETVPKKEDVVIKEPEPENEDGIKSKIAKICTHVLCGDPEDTDKASDPFGEKTFRAAIASFLKSNLNIHTVPEQIVVSSDASHLLRSILSLQTIREPFEKSNGMGLLKLADKLSSGSATPIKAMTGLAKGTDEKTKRIFSKSKLPYREIPSDELGLNPQNPENADSTSIFIVPGDLKPLTTGDSNERIWTILDWAYQVSYRHIIEYDTLPLFKEKSSGDTEYLRIKSSDLRNKVIYINSFENLLWSGFKAAFAVLPSAVCADYHQFYDYLPCPLSLLEQQILTEFINGGNLEQISRGLYGKEKD